MTLDKYIMEKFVLLPHDKYQKLSTGRGGGFLSNNQLPVKVPPPGLPATGLRTQIGPEIDSKMVELKRDRKFEKEVEEISDTDSESGSEIEHFDKKDWVRMWKEVTKRDK